MVSEYYINDAGRQMKLLGVSVLARYLESCGQTVPFPEDGYQGRLYSLKSRRRWGRMNKGTHAVASVEDAERQSKDSPIESSGP